MTESGSDSTADPPKDGRGDSGASAPPRALATTAPAAAAGREAANPFLSHLQSLRELLITLSQEGRAESILSGGTTGTVEIVGADCAVAIVEPSNGLPPLRFGWLEGRQMAQHEILMVCRRLEEPMLRVRSGKVTRVVLGAAEDIDPSVDAAPAPGGRPMGGTRPPRFGSTLVLGIDAAMGSRGALVLARHDPLP